MVRISILSLLGIAKSGSISVVIKVWDLTDEVRLLKRGKP